MSVAGHEFSLVNRKRIGSAAVGVYSPVVRNYI